MKQKDKIEKISETIHYLLKGSIPKDIDVSNYSDDEIKRLSQTVNQLIESFSVVRDFVLSLSQGILDKDVPTGFFLGSPFKELQSNLRHLTWQTQQIAKGDFSQRVDFMGDFSKAFNSMVIDLDDHRKELTEYTESIIKSMADTLIVLNLETKIKTINKAALDLLGYREEELIGKQIATIIKEEDLFKSAESIKLVEKEFISNYETTYKTKDGNVVPILLSYSTMKDNEGRLTAIVVVGKDITEHKLAEEEKKKLESQLFQAEKMEAIGTLAGGIAHDFNNLLAAVLGNISIAQMETKPGTKAFELLTEAENAGMQAKDLTARLITFSKGGEPFKQEVSIGGFVKDSVSSALSGSDIDSEFTIPDDLWPVNIDERQIKQVIHNIVINAIGAISTRADGAAGRAGKGKVNVYCENATVMKDDALLVKAGKYVRISIKDQGIGIPKENLTKIFEPYFSTKEMGTDKGMGLGLAVSHSIVKKHDGLITVESELGAGTTFHIYLPESDLGLRNADLGLERKLRTKQKPIIGKIKILVMDDEDMVREVTAAMLSRLGYEVEVAVEGSEAIEMYKKAKESDQSYDGVILDLTNKIGMGGVEAIKRLLEIAPDVKGIVSTGYSYDPIVTKFKEYGFCGALTKPFTMDELRKTIISVIERD